MTFNVSPLPFTSEDDVLALLPLFLRPNDPAPVRDALLTALLALCQSCQDWAQYAADQSSALFATGPQLATIGAEREIFQNGDAAETYRARILTPPTVASPNAIVTATNAILAPYTAISAKYCEMSDRLFARVDGAMSGPFAYVYADGTAPRSPDYADRLYVSEAAQNGGYATLYREPGAARVFADVPFPNGAVGRFFLLRVPDISSLDAQDAPIYQEPQPNDFCVAATLANFNTAFVLRNATTSAAVYAAIVNVVNRIKGQSMRFALLVDPLLTS